MNTNVRLSSVLLRLRIRRRGCLRCGIKFLSLSPANRFCPKCAEYFQRFRLILPPMPQRPRWILPPPREDDDEDEDGQSAAAAAWYAGMTDAGWLR